jgi:DNA modification methylase
VNKKNSLGYMKIENIATNDLIPYARNAKRHDEAQVAKLAGSIREFGFNNPVLIDKDNGIVAGHGRIMAAQKLGLDKVPCIRLGHLTDTQRRAYILADNRLAEIGGGWDEEMLKVELGALADQDIDLEALGFGDDFEIDLDDKDEAETSDADAEPQIDKAEELRAKWGVEPGQLWELGEHRLLCGDSTKKEDVERVMGGEKAEMMFTDPPYGVNYEGGHFHSGNVNIKRKREKLADDDSTAIYAAFLPAALSVVDGPCYMWFAASKARDVYNTVHEAGCEVHALIIWHKTNATYAAMNAQYKQRHEPCLYFKPRGSTLRWCGASTEATVWNQDRDGINEFHPTQKPVALAAKAIGNHKAKIIFEAFNGSGTTIIACEQLGRKCRAIEISPAYVAVAIQRWVDATGKEPRKL